MTTLFNATNQREFLYHAFEHHRIKSGYGYGKWGFVPSYREDVIRWLYKLGRDYQIVQMDYAEFERVMLCYHDYYRDFDYKTHWHINWRNNKGYCRRRWSSRSHYCPIEEYRVIKSFTNNGQKKKPAKDKSWWEHKGIVKDRRKNRWHSGWKKNLKYYGARKHRRFEKQMIHYEQYESLHRLTYKQAEDPWGWD